MREIITFKVLRFSGLGPKMTFFGFGQYGRIFFFGNTDSYEKKITENNGERISAQSIAVFCLFKIENCTFVLYHVNANTYLAKIQP